MGSLFRRPSWLLALTLAAFAVQTDDFIIIGVLPAIAADVGVSEAAAGQLVTAYSLIYALVAPLWSLLLSRVARKKALSYALMTFGAANVAVALVNSYPVLMALRVVAALAAAVVLPTALAAASIEAPPEQRGRYLATVMTGLTGAILIGVPLGTWIGAVLGWKASFVLGGLFGIGALLLLARTLPAADTHAPAQGGTPADVVRPLLNGTVAVILVVTVLAVAGNLAFQTYIALFLADIAGVTPAVLAALLVCAGIGGVLGAQSSGWLVDRYGPLRAFTLATTVFCGAMLLFALSWAIKPVPVVAVAVLLACWSAAAWAIPPSIQALMLDRAGNEAASQAMAIHSSAVYVGAALGGAMGGTLVAVQPGLLPLAATLSAVLGLVLTRLGARARTVKERV